MSASPPVAGVIVTFHPDAHFERRLAAIARETSPLLVVDNTARPETANRLRAACAAHGATLLANPKNVGLAAALNQAFRQLEAQGIAFAVAFDQDSTPEPGFVAALRLAHTDAGHAVVGANWYDEARPDVPARHLQHRPGWPGGFRRVAANGNLFAVTCVITSGSLFHLPTWRELGGFDEPLFLDLVDTEYCLRARAAGRFVGVAWRARLAHRRGAKAAVGAFGGTWWPAFMSPLRLRYLFRNRLLVAFRHGWRSPHWVAFELVYAAKILAEIVFLEDHKAAKLAACARGTWDGLCGVEGKIPAA